MAEPTVIPDLSSRALQRLRKLAAGNGLEPAAITMSDVQEQVFILGGVMQVSPLCETQSATYPGLPRGKDRKIMPDPGALQQAVAKHRADFQQSPDWIEAVTAEIKSHDGQGWGLERAKVTLPAKSTVYAAAQVCPSCEGRKVLTCAQCHGQGTVICNQCQGQGRELCYHCSGRGEDPQAPGQRCNTCNGTRYAPCRYCQTHRYLTCPTCQGRRGTPCPSCNATGRITTEIAVTCGAETHFRLTADGDYPAGLRRGLERIGVANLGKGHAEIAVAPPAQTLLDEHNGQPPFPVLSYRVSLPYAEMRVAIGGRKAVISAVGKRCAINGVPNFLDDSLKPWRDRLRDAAQGRAPIEPALEARALNDIVALTVAGRGIPVEVRRAYPLGLSAGAIDAILDDMRLALNQATLKTRGAIAALCAAVCAGLFYLFYDGGLRAGLVAGWPDVTDAAADLGVLAAALTASWATVNMSTLFVLKRRFPQLSVSLQQKIGKTGYAMLAGIAVCFVAILATATPRPSWLTALLG